MIEFDKINHIEFNENFQGVNLTEFTIRTDNKTTTDEIVDSFIQSKSFTYESLSNCIKEEPEKNFLRRAFDFSIIKFSDFKKTDHVGTTKFLFDFINEPNWGDDRNKFAKLLDKYFEFHSLQENRNFYIISKDWFNKDDERVIEPEHWCYTYYFLIFSIDRKSNILSLSEWKYD
jgi:hypothetical protein